MLPRWRCRRTCRSAPQARSICSTMSPGGSPMNRSPAFSGKQEFWGLPFGLSPETLVPRPDTETVVEAALAAIPDRAARLRILDLGTGSGCLLVALLHELPDAHGIGVDRSPAALATARQNARRNGVADRAGFVAGDWGAALRPDLRADRREPALYRHGRDRGPCPRGPRPRSRRRPRRRPGRARCLPQHLCRRRPAPRPRRPARGRDRL